MMKFRPIHADDPQQGNSSEGYSCKAASSAVHPLIRFIYAEHG
jgi:hypothetical protein